MSHNAALQAFERLLTIMDELREKCPWDKEQTITSIRHLTIEETYELNDAILQMDYDEIKKELGDILLHIVFYSKIASETSLFSITEVIHTLCDKLVRRHPHIYGNTEAKDAQAVKQNWEQIKLKEKSNEKPSVLSGVPSSMPSLVKAFRMQEKAAQVGFDWDNKEQVWQKVEEEILEFKTAKTQEQKTEELGDVLFSLVNYARFANINPDDALELTNKKFKLRFQYIEQKASENNISLKEVSLAQMEQWWQEAKQL